ncbi:MAG: metallophosphoesterase [Candidatus Adiutrix sp.]|jgi:predicted MPP superfamily phosphohydrolase|nr:metallophosphoesterase [Candidatus Adiutrix sp.]
MESYFMSFYMMRLLVEAALSLHFFIRLRLAFGGGWWQLPVMLGMALMLLPLAVRGSGGALPASLAEILLFLWPYWLGFLLFFTLCALALDLARLFCGLSGALLGGRSWWNLLRAKRAVPAALLLAVLLAALACYQAYHPRLVRLTLTTSRLPAGVDSFRIVQLTDVHLSRFIGHSDLKRIVDLVREARPDLLAVTGDLVDGDLSNRPEDARLLAEISPRWGAFAVLGNHELYAGESKAEAFCRLAGLRLLRGEAVKTGGLWVAGMDDEAFGGRGDREPPGRLLRALQDDGAFVLFLKHRPRPAPGTEGLFDLQLSGHTHGGQIWPGHYLIKRANGFLYGLDRAPGARGRIYTSRGAGFWGLPFRFLAPPEVLLIDLRRP